jgi:hypothetical protein
MQPGLEMRRHHDGSIDFDFYRRRAARRRRLVKRMMFKRHLSVSVQATKASVSVIARAIARLARDVNPAARTPETQLQISGRVK